jgi:hypothetical protein
VLVGSDATGTALPTITSSTPLSDPSPASLDPPTPPSGGRADVIQVSNGFFIRGRDENDRYIVCPASTVLLPPALSAVATRYPYASETDAIPDGTIRPGMVRAGRILVDVFNVNTKGRELGKARSYTYLAELIGVDGAADVALLRIDSQSSFNKDNPCINGCHPYLHLNTDALKGDGRGPAARGQRVYMLGDYLVPLNRNASDSIVPFHLTRTAMGITEGLLAHHRHADNTGWATQELVLVSGANIGSAARGMPVVNAQGFVLGMQTLNPSSIQENTGTILGIPGAAPGTVDLLDSQYEWENNPAMAAGPSSLVLSRSIRILTRGQCGRSCYTDCDPVEIIDDFVGSYLRVRKGYAGIATDVLVGHMYDTTTDYSSSALPGTAGSFGGLPRVIFDDAGNQVDGSTNKEIAGMRVLAVGGPVTPVLPVPPVPASGFWHVGNFAPGGLPVPSPFASRIRPGDVIYAIEGKLLGDIAEQIVPTIVTWVARLSRVSLEFRKTNFAPNSGLVGVFSPIYENKNKHEAALADYPAWLDYPHYATSMWPRLRSFFSAYAAGMDSTLQLPQAALADTNTVSRFHPSW